jgi:hypothetical protein
VSAHSSPALNSKPERVLLPKPAVMSRGFSDIYETVKLSLILIAPFLFQAGMPLEPLTVRCVLLFVGRH